jgi:phosphatidylserine/phosphatidylglycerophosphate/cardiolipin synthase-like enzyme
MPATELATFSPRGGALQQQLFAAIACADQSLRAAIYETSSSCVVDALLAKLAQDSDVAIQLLIDDDQCPRVNGVLDCELSRLDGHPRVSIADDARSRYMHHKFIIVVGRMVWIGSANMTRNSFCSENNNALVVDQPEIVAGYETEFQRMFTARELGPIARTPVTGGAYTLYFSPETPITSSPEWFEQIVHAIDTASTSVDSMIFALTRFEVGNAIANAHLRGVRVRGLIAPEYISDPVAESLLAAQVPVKVAPIHSKLLIVDEHLVVTGSPNWSQNSWENNEASLFIDSSTVAAQFKAEIDRVFPGALPP